MPWIVRFEDEFEQEFLALEQEVQDELLVCRASATIEKRPP